MAIHLNENGHYRCNHAIKADHRKMTILASEVSCKNCSRTPSKNEALRQLSAKEQEIKRLQEMVGDYQCNMGKAHVRIAELKRDNQGFRELYAATDSKGIKQVKEHYEGEIVFWKKYHEQDNRLLTKFLEQNHELKAQYERDQKWIRELSDSRADLYRKTIALKAKIAKAYKIFQDGTNEDEEDDDWLRRLGEALSTDTDTPAEKKAPAVSEDTLSLALADARLEFLRLKAFPASEIWLLGWQDLFQWLINWQKEHQR